MTPTTASSTRLSRSQEQLLAAIRAANGVSRADLHRATGLSRSAVAEAVQVLLDAGLAAEQVPPPQGKGAGAGRPAAVLLPAGATGLVAGLDFGHAHISAAIAETDGVVLRELRVPVDVDHRPADAFDTAAALLMQLLTEAGHTTDDLLATAVGVPTPLDVRTGRPRPYPVLAGWQGLDPAAELAERLGVPVIVGNDADMGAQGELRYGAARGLRDFVYVKVSAGVGAGLVLDREALRGAGGLAGEIGHIRLSERGGLPCRCGNSGCLETLLSTNVIEARFRELASATTDAVFPLREHVADPVIATYLREAGRTLGRAVADLANWINPEGIVVGGVLGSAGGAAADAVRAGLARHTSPTLQDGLDVRAAELGLRSELLGSVAVACRIALRA